MVGIPRSTLVLGKHSGRHALERRYRELGYDLTELQLAEVYRQFTALADRKREILDEDLLALVHALNKAHHADRLEASSLNSIYLWGV